MLVSFAVIRVEAWLPGRDSTTHRAKRIAEHHQQMNKAGRRPRSDLEEYKVLAMRVPFEMVGQRVDPVVLLGVSFSALE